MSGAAARLHQQLIGSELTTFQARRMLALNLAFTRFRLPGASRVDAAP